MFKKSMKMILEEEKDNGLTRGKKKIGRVISGRVNLLTPVYFSSRMSWFTMNN